MAAVMTRRDYSHGTEKYPDELREATRMALEALADPARAKGALRQIARKPGFHHESLRTWVRQAQGVGKIGG